MEREELRAIQVPLKERYESEPGAAVVTLTANGALGEGVSCSVDTGRALSEAGLHPASGGDGSQLCSGDMLLEALVACAGVTLRAVATSLGIAVGGGTVHAEGELDFRGTLAVDRDAPVGFRSIRLGFDLDTDANEEELAILLKLTERYCVVFQTLSSPPELSATLAPKSKGTFCIWRATCASASSTVRRWSPWIRPSSESSSKRSSPAFPCSAGGWRTSAAPKLRRPLPKRSPPTSLLSRSTRA